MVLLALNSRQTELLNGTSVGQLPKLQWNMPWRERVQGAFEDLHGNRHKEMSVEPQVGYEDLEFQLEADNNQHLQLTAYGKRGKWQNLRVEPHPPRQDEFYR